LIGKVYQREKVSQPRPTTQCAQNAGYAGYSFNAAGYLGRWSL